MKKKAKLFTTFASLGLALALMGFGVWAATNQVMNVESTVSFKTTAVNVMIAAEVSDWGGTEGAARTQNYDGYTTDADDLADQPDKWTVGENLKVDDKENAHRFICYDITVTNLSGFAVKTVISDVVVPTGFTYEVQLTKDVTTPIATSAATEILELDEEDGTTASGHIYLVVYLADTTLNVGSDTVGEAITYTVTIDAQA